MPETTLAIDAFRVLTIRLEPTDVTGSGCAAWPRLSLRLRAQLEPIREASWFLLRLAGAIRTQPLGDFAGFDLGPLAEQPCPHPFFAQHVVNVDLDPFRVRRFEEARSGRNADFEIAFSALAWLPDRPGFQAIQGGPLQVSVPRSHWVDNVLSRWGLSNVKMIEIRFAASPVADNYRAAYAKVEAAEKLFANGQWKPTLGELYSAFEGLAKSHNYGNPDQQFFAGLLSDLHTAKRQKLKLALDSFCDLLHMGRHEPKESPGTFEITPRDARFALTMAHAIFEYITPQT